MVFFRSPEQLKAELTSLENEDSRSARKRRRALKNLLRQAGVEPNGDKNNGSHKKTSPITAVNEENLSEVPPGEIVKKYPDGFVIIKGNPTNWNDAYSEFVIKCPGGRQTRYADTFKRAKEIVWELQEYGEYIKW